MVVFVVKRYAVHEAENWRYAIRKAKIGRYAVRKGRGGVTLSCGKAVGIFQRLNSYIYAQ